MSPRSHAFRSWGRLGATLAACWLLGALQLAAQVGALSELAVLIYRPLGSDQFTQDSGTLYADGRLVVDNRPNPAPLFVLGLSAAQLAAINGRPMFFADFWSDDPNGAYRNFRRSTESYPILGNRFYIVSAAPVTTVTTAISPATRGIGASGATGLTIAVTSNGAWTATSNVSWLVLASGTSGNGSGTVVYSAAANAATTSRSGTIRIANQVHTVTQAGAAPVRPTNDSRSAAETLAAAEPTLTRSSTNATVDPGDPFRIAGFPPLATVWWRWTAPAAVRATVSTSGSDYDTLLGVYTAAGTLVAENDDTGDGATSRVSFDAVAGAQYFIAVDGFLGATGTVRLSVSFVPRGAGTSSPAARLANIATRAQVGTGGNVLIPGIVVGGTGRKTLLLRGVGPTLGLFGVEGSLGNPTVTLLRGAVTVAANDDWSAEAEAGMIATTAAATGAFALPQGSRDAALLVTLDPGAYTLQMSGVGGGTGVGLVEIYDTGAGAASARLVNIATRARVGTGGDVLIPGFVVAGTGARRLLIRGIGPSLAPFGVEGVLRDPFMVLLAGATPLAANDDAGVSGTDGEVRTAEAAVGAFARLPGAADAAMVVTVAPGAYTVQVSGVGGATGLALVEIYEVP